MHGAVRLSSRAKVEVDFQLFVEVGGVRILIVAKSVDHGSAGKSQPIDPGQSLRESKFGPCQEDNSADWDVMLKF